MNIKYYINHYTYSIPSVIVFGSLYSIYIILPGLLSGLILKTPMNKIVEEIIIWFRKKSDF